MKHMVPTIYLFFIKPSNTITTYLFYLKAYIIISATYPKLYLDLVLFCVQNLTFPLLKTNLFSFVSVSGINCIWIFA